jgi:hypothetical protein
VLRIVLPVLIPALDIVLLVVVIYVFVVVVDVDIAVTPATSVTPTPISPGGTDRNSSAERQQSISRRVVHRWIGIGRRTIYHRGIIRRDVNDLRVGLLNHDHVLAFDRFTFHFLLLAGF